MEPAVERREHSALSCSRFSGIGPQWSPPLDSGSTTNTEQPLDMMLLPQWSPPLNGGSTGLAGSARPHVSMPQWSPPWIGGSRDAQSHDRRYR